MSRGSITAQVREALVALERELAALDVTRARPELLDGITVEVGSARVPLVRLGRVSVRGPRTLHVAAFDGGNTRALERAVRLAFPDLSVSGRGDGLTVELPTPTADRRTSLQTDARAAGERARIRIRLVRQDALKRLKSQEQAGTLTGRQRGGRTKDVQARVDEAIAEVARLVGEALGRLQG